MATVPGPAVGDPVALPAPRAEAPVRDDLGHFDSRLAVSPRKSRGIRGLFEIDPATGTVRILEKLDGFLTGPSGRPARSVALSYVRQHVVALGLTRADLRTFHFHRDYVDIEGTHHLSWTQEIGGEKIFDAGLQASVTRSGRLLTISGSPVSKASAPSRSGGTVTSATAAITAARTDGDEPSVVPGPDDSAEAVVFVANGRSHAAWETITMSAERPTLSVFDAANGQLLYRRPLAQDEHSRGTAVEYFPGADHGGRQKHVDFTARGWLAARRQEPLRQQLAHLLRRQRRPAGRTRARRCRR